MKHLQVFENFDDFLIKFDNNKYISISDKDIIPDTNYGVYRKYNDNNLYLVDKSNVDKLDEQFSFLGIAITWDYYYKAMKIYDHYNEVSSYNDGVRSEDEQYYEPYEDELHQEYSKYWKEGNWSDLFWDFTI